MDLDPSADIVSPITPMLTALMILAAIYLTGLLVLAGAVWRAPEGFEDDKGFHKGRTTLPDDVAL